MIHRADTSLKPHEKEEKEVSRLINKKPAPSRKNRPKRGPKHDNRRRRMKVDDPDMNTFDRDLSLSERYAFTLENIALKIAAKDKFDIASERIDKVTNELNNVLPALGKDFESFANRNWLNSGMLPEKIINKCKSVTHDINLKPIRLARMTPHDISKALIESWPSGESESWGKRAWVIRSIRSAVNSIDVPSSLKASFQRQSGNRKLDLKLIRKIIEDSSNVKSSGIDPDELLSFASMAAAYEVLTSNPKSIGSDITKLIDEASASVYEQISGIASVMSYIGSIESGMKELSKVGKSDSSADYYMDADDFYHSSNKVITNFLSKPKGLSDIIDPALFTKEFESQLKSKYGDKIPINILDFSFKHSSQATSNEKVSSKAMTQKNASYHGVIVQHNPAAEPQPCSYDKRYFGKKEYDIIISTAKELLKEDWFKYTWEGGSIDTPIRAALDIAIHTAEDCLFQSKIDTETYNMLFGKLREDKTDLFSETQLYDQTRVSSDMHPEKMLEMARSVYASDPKRSFDMIKSAHLAIFSNDGSSSHTAAGEIVRELRRRLEPLHRAIGKKDVEAYIKALGAFSDIIRKSSSDVAITELEQLEDMDDEEVLKFLKLQDDRLKDLDKLLNASDVEKFMHGVSELIGEAVEQAKNIRTGTVQVQLSTLIKLAHENPSARPILMPILSAVKNKIKSKPKAKSEKTSQKKSDEDAEEKFDFKKKDSPKKVSEKPAAKPAGKKKKASVAIESSDIDW